jgi:hypothetical protein
MSVITVWGRSGQSVIGIDSTDPSRGVRRPPWLRDDGVDDDDDGGYEDGIDNTINQPVITFPNASDNENIEAADTATSSAFVATDARTHIASRWQIVLIGPTGMDNPLNPPSTIMYDSGAQAANLVSLPFAGLEFQHETVYGIRVRYKASGTLTWSAWSELQEFTTVNCQDEGLILWVDASDAATLTPPTGVLVTQWADKSPEENHLIGSTAAAGTYASISTTQFAAGAMDMSGGLGFLLTNLLDLTAIGGKMSVFMVMYWPSPGAIYRGLGFMKNLDGFNQSQISIYSSAGNTGSQVFSDAVDSLTSGVNTIPTDKYVYEALIDSAVASELRLNGVLKDSGADNFGGANWDRLGVQNGSFGWTGPIGGQIAEIKIYGFKLSAAQAAEVREALAAKWGITL